MAAELEGSKSLSGLLSGLAQDTFYGHPGITEELLRSQLYPEVSPEEFRPFLAKMKGILKSKFLGLLFSKQVFRSQNLPWIEGVPGLSAALNMSANMENPAVAAGVEKSIASADMDFNQLEAFLTAQTKKQGGITPEQAAVISRFWKSHKTKIRESLMNQSRWDSGLRGLSWRVDGKSQSRHSPQIHTPVAIMELEIGKSGQDLYKSKCKDLYLPVWSLTNGLHLEAPESEFLCLEFDELKVNQVLKKLSEVEESISTLMQPA
ncbi:COMM domain-containing protein 1 isoform X2 [Odocoileus virginianus]|uniref:COMM domain-containing protein 1 n=1 Tax=Odocoileus virginianus TaxID=9874 RepID=A0ABM4J7Q5_ODOVR